MVQRITVPGDVPVGHDRDNICGPFFTALAEVQVALVWCVWSYGEVLVKSVWTHPLWQRPPSERLWFTGKFFSSFKSYKLLISVYALLEWRQRFMLLFHASAVHSDIQINNVLTFIQTSQYIRNCPPHICHLSWLFCWQNLNTLKTDVCVQSDACSFRLSLSVCLVFHDTSNVELQVIFSKPSQDLR